MRVRPNAAIAIAFCLLTLLSQTGCGQSLPGASSTSPSGGAVPAVNVLSSKFIYGEDAAPSVAWPQFGLDSGHSGYNPTETAITLSNVSSLQAAWVDKAFTQPSGIVVDKGTEYVADGTGNPGSLYAINAATGAPIWTANVALGSVNLLAVPAVYNHIVLSPCSTGSGSTFKSGLCGISAGKGTILWKHLCTPYQQNTCTGVFYHGTSPTVDGHFAYFQMIQGINEEPDIQAVDATTGKLAWDVGGSYLYHCPDAGGPSNPLPVANGYVYAVLSCYSYDSGQNGTYVCALAESSGALAWCTQSQTAYVEALVAGEGKVFASENGSSNGQNIVAMDQKTGKIIWTAPTSPLNTGAIAVANNRVFVNEYSEIYAFSAQTGKQLWMQTQGVAGGDASVANGLVYTNNYGGYNGDVSITALNEKTGAVVWESPPGNGHSAASPVILDGTVYTSCYYPCAYSLPSNLRAKGSHS